MLISSQRKPGIMSLAEKPTQKNLNVTSQNFLRKKMKWILQKEKDAKVKKKTGIEKMCQYIKGHIIEKAHVVRISYLKEL